MQGSEIDDCDDDKTDFQMLLRLALTVAVE